MRGEDRKDENKMSGQEERRATCFFQIGIK